MTISMTGGMNGTFIAHPINLLVHNLFGGTMSGYLRRIDFLNKEKQKRKQRWTCVHCKTGIVDRLPAKCPECDRYLTEAVIQSYSNMDKPAAFKGRESRK
mgnify:CR=1 FL=1